MLGANKLPLREVGGFAANFNRANRRGTAFGGKSTHSHAVSDRVGALPIKRARANESPCAKPTAKPWASTAQTGVAAGFARDFTR